MSRRLPLFILGAIVLPGFGLLGCEDNLIRLQDSSPSIDPPPKSLEEAWLNGQTKSVRASKVNDNSGYTSHNNEEHKKISMVELYLLSGEGYLVPYSVPFPFTSQATKIRDSLQLLIPPSIHDAQVSNQQSVKRLTLPPGFNFPLPADVRVLGVEQNKGVLNVDLSKEFLQYQDNQEKNIISALVWTLTGFSAVNMVNLFVEGEPLQEMPKQKTPAQNLTRANVGINIEDIQNVRPGDSMPVVLYFLCQDRDKRVYYVPVTRMIQRTKDIPKAALQALIEGPRPGTKLVNAVDADMRVHSVSVKDDVITVDLDERLLQYHPQGIASQEAMQTIVLSLTDNIKAQKVRIIVNGKEKNDDKQTQDVMRPQWINPSVS